MMSPDFNDLRSVHQSCVFHSDLINSFNKLYSQENLDNEMHKGTVMQIEKALINDLLRVSKVSLKFRIRTIYNFEVISPRNLLTVCIVCSVYKRNFMAQ